VAQHVPVGNDLLDDVRVLLGVGAPQAEHGGDVVLPQDLQQAGGVRGVRAVVEGQRDAVAAAAGRVDDLRRRGGGGRGGGRGSGGDQAEGGGQQRDEPQAPPAGPSGPSQAARRKGRGGGESPSPVQGVAHAHSSPR